MEEFIKLIEDIGFIKSSSMDDFTKILEYSYPDSKIYKFQTDLYEGYHIAILDDKLSWLLFKTGLAISTINFCTRKLSYSVYEYDVSTSTYKKYIFKFTEIGLLETHFTSYFRDNKLKELGI